MKFFGMVFIALIGAVCGQSPLGQFAERATSAAAGTSGAIIGAFEGLAAHGPSGVIEGARQGAAHGVALAERIVNNGVGNLGGIGAGPLGGISSGNLGGSGVGPLGGISSGNLGGIGPLGGISSGNLGGIGAGNGGLGSRPLGGIASGNQGGIGSGLLGLL